MDAVVVGLDEAHLHLCLDPKPDEWDDEKHTECPSLPEDVVGIMNTERTQSDSPASEDQEESGTTHNLKKLSMQSSQ